MAQDKPSLPESYKLPEVWKAPAEASGTNLPTAGPRSTEELPKGEHAIQLYSLGTPNGNKVTILLEELGVEYDAWFISIMEAKQFTSGFVACNPNSKIPCLYDYSPDSNNKNAKASTKTPLRVFESGSILCYLAEKYGRFIPKSLRSRTECMNWLMWQMGCGPVMGGCFGHFFKFAPFKIEYCINRFTMETKRLLDVLDQHLGGTSDGRKKTFICGDEYSIADMAIVPWIRVFSTAYGAAAYLDLKSYQNVNAWLDRLLERKPVKRGLRVNGFTPSDVKERHSRQDFLVEDYDPLETPPNPASCGNCCNNQ